MRRPSRTARRSPRSDRLQRAVPARGVDADRADLDAVLARVAHDLRRGVEAHRLGVEQRRAEHVRMLALQPGRGVGDQREGGGVALRKAVAAEALELLEGPLGEVRARSRCATMPATSLSLELRDAAGELEGRHAAPELVGLAGGEAGAFDRDPHRLLLEQRHAERLAEHLSPARASG